MKINTISTACVKVSRATLNAVTSIREVMVNSINDELTISRTDLSYILEDVKVGDASMKKSHMAKLTEIYSYMRTNNCVYAILYA